MREEKQLENLMEHCPIQIMDITALKAVVADLRRKIIPSRIEKIQQPDLCTLQIGFRTLKKLYWIEISWHADSARIVELEKVPRVKGESTLSKQIKFGSRDMALIEIKQEGFERIIEFGFAFRPNETPYKFLLIELMGRHSKLLFLNNERKVITISKQIRKSKSRLRPISTGDKYSQPPALQGISPNKSQPFSEWKKDLSLIPIPLKDAFKQTFKGMSPSFLVQLAGDEKNSSEQLLNKNVDQITKKIWENLFSRWREWLNILEEESFQLSYNGPTDYQVWLPNLSYLKEETSISLSLGIYYHKKLDENKLHKAFNQISNDLIKRKMSEEVLLKKQNYLYSKTLDINLIKERADKILSVNKPSKEKIKEAQDMYSKVKKLKRSKEIIQKRINYHIDKINFINETDLFLDYIITNNKTSKSEKLTEIMQLKDDLESFLLTKTQKVKTTSNKEVDVSNILRIKSPNGLIIYIGRNHLQNEFISLKKARKGDIWFHVQECPGSHIVVKASNGTAEESDIQVCADLAAFFSKAKLNKKVSILMVPTHKLKKLKGTAPGVVSPREIKILWGDPAKGEKYMDQSTKNA